MSNNKVAHIFRAPYTVRRTLVRASETNIHTALLEAAQLIVDRPLFQLRNFADSRKDKRTCGTSLEKSVASPFGDSHGAVDSIHSPYGSLEKILGPETFGKNDVFLDVGCGKGRPLAYLLGKNFPGRLYGVELTPEVAKFAQDWAKRFDNVEIFSDDVFNLDLSYVTHYFMFIPMSPRFSRRLISKIETECQGRVRLYYLSDMQDGDYIDSRPGWTLVRRGWIYRKFGIPLHGTPQRYSVWDYTGA